MPTHRWMVSLTVAAGACVLALALTASADETPAAKPDKPKLKLSPAAAAAIAEAAEKKKDAPSDEKKGDKPATDDADSAEKEKAADEAAAKLKERFTVPEGDVQALLVYLQDLMTFQPKTRQEFVALRTQGMAAMKEAAEKIKKLATDADKKLPGFGEVEAVLLYIRAQDRELSPEDQKALVGDLKQYFVGNAEPSKYAVMAVQMIGSSAERGGDPSEAVALYRTIGPELAKSTNEQYAKVGRKMEGSIRRLELPGNQMEITGHLLDGAEFDWAKYRGKVVLVDFWATWCGPCIGELPNVRTCYEQYHDKGFDVVGISLDNDVKRLEDFVKNEQLPWPTIYDAGGWDTPMANYYGINSIPRAILVDKDGKVVSMSARGPELNKLLTELLGPANPPESKSENKDTAEKDADKAAAK